MAIIEWRLLIATVCSIICVCLILCSLSVSSSIHVSKGAPGSFNSSFLPLFIFVCLSQYLSWGLNVFKVSLLKWICLYLIYSKIESHSMFSVFHKKTMRGGEQRCKVKIIFKCYFGCVILLKMFNLWAILNSIKCHRLMNQALQFCQHTLKLVRLICLKCGYLFSLFFSVDL